MKNISLNLIGYIIPVLIGLLAIPFAIKGLGVERFGILSLAWTLITYFTFSDLGLAESTTKFLAEYLGQKKYTELSQIFWTSFISQMLLGFLAIIILFTITPILVNRLFQIPSNLIQETIHSFYALGGLIFIMLLNGSLKSVLQATQKFNLLNYIKIATSLNYIIPALSYIFPLKLPFIFLALTFINGILLVIYFSFCYKTLPILKQNVSICIQKIKFLFWFSGWVAVSNIIWVILTKLDYFFIGAIINVTAVGYYTAPFEITSKLWIIPFSFFPLLPAFSALGKEKKKQITHILSRSIKYILIIMVPIITFFIVWSQEILHFWLGNEFQKQTTHSLQILSISVIAVAVASIANCLIKSFNRPDLIAKLYLGELFFYPILLWALISNYGITGAALAWAIKSFIDVAFMLFFVYKCLPDIWQAFKIIKGQNTIIILLLMLIISFSLKIYLKHYVLFIIFCLFFIICGCIIWKYSLDKVDKNLIKKIVLLKNFN